MVVRLTTGNNNLTVYVYATIDGSCTAGGIRVQRAIANGSTSPGENGLFVSPGTTRSLKAGAGVSLTTDTSTNVAIVKASLANYVSGAGVQYLVDTTAQAINSLLFGNSNKNLAWKQQYLSQQRNR